MVAADLSLRPVAADDGDLIAALSAAGLPTADLSEPDQRFFAFESGAAVVVGYGGLARAGNVGLLRSLVVLPGWRRQGYGGACLHALISEARRDGLNELYLLTTTAEAFFRGHNFTRIPRPDAPPEIAGLREFQECCPRSAIVLRRKAADRV